MAKVHAELIHLRQTLGPDATLSDGMKEFFNRSAKLCIITALRRKKHQLFLPLKLTGGVKKLFDTCRNPVIPPD